MTLSYLDRSKCLNEKVPFFGIQMLKTLKQQKDMKILLTFSASVIMLTASCGGYTKFDNIWNEMDCLKLTKKKKGEFLKFIHSPL